MNNIVLSGRLIKNPERVASKNGKNFTNICISVRKFGKDENGYPKSMLVNCVAFGMTGENVAKYFSKGDTIIVSGELDINKSNDKTYTSVVINGFDFCGKRDGSEEASDTPTEKTVAPDMPSEASVDLPFDF